MWWDLAIHDNFSIHRHGGQGGAGEGYRSFFLRFRSVVAMLSLVLFSVFFAFVLLDLTSLFSFRSVVIVLSFLPAGLADYQCHGSVLTHLLIGTHFCPELLSTIVRVSGRVIKLAM